MVFDLPRTPYRRIFEWCRANDCRTLVFDILGGFSAPADLVVNDALAPGLTDYPNLAPTTRLMLGPAYFMLPKPLPAPAPRPEVRRILITMGGSDPAGLTMRLLDTVVARLDAFHLDVVLGPCFGTTKEAAARAAALPHVALHFNPNDFLGMLGACDLAISAGGRTLYELAHLGKPVVVLPSIEHEILAGNAMEKALGWRCLDLWNEHSGNALLESVRALLPWDIRDVIHRLGPALVDGKGAERVLSALSLGQPSSLANQAAL